MQQVPLYCVLAGILASSRDENIILQAYKVQKRIQLKGSEQQADLVHYFEIFLKKIIIVCNSQNM